MCLRLTGTGFAGGTTYTLQSEDGDGVVRLAPDTFNNKWYMPVDVQQLTGVYGATVPGTVVNEIRTDGLTLWTNDPSRAPQRQGVSYSTFLSSSLQYDYRTNGNASAAAWVRLVIQYLGMGSVWNYTKALTASTLPDVLSGALVFTPADATAGPWAGSMTPGTITVQQFLPAAGVIPRASVFASATEIDTTISARGSSAQIAFTRVSEFPSIYSFQCPDYATYDPLAVSSFRYVDNEWGASWIVAVEPSCSRSGKLEIHVWGAILLPGSATGSVAIVGSDWPIVRYDDLYSVNVGGASAPPYFFGDDYGQAVFGAVDYPTFPVTLYDGPSHYWRAGTNQIFSGLPRVVLTLDGVS